MRHVGNRLKDQPGGLVIRDRTQLVRCDSRGRINPAGGHHLTEPTRAAAEATISAAEAAGLRLRIASSHRTRGEQMKLFERGILKHGSAEAARKWIAHPDTAPHCTGQAVDFQMGLPISSEAAKSGAYQRSPEWKWFNVNGPRFGWVEYKPEPWHMEHVGG